VQYFVIWMIKLIVLLMHCNWHIFLMNSTSVTVLLYVIGHIFCITWGSGWSNFLYHSLWLVEFVLYCRLCLSASWWRILDDKSSPHSCRRRRTSPQLVSPGKLRCFDTCTSVTRATTLSQQSPRWVVRGGLWGVEVVRYLYQWYSRYNTHTTDSNLGG
jgi:hypothetical protein